MIYEYFKELNNLNEDIYLDENFQIHTSLNSKLFDIDDNIMFAEVRERLIEIADLFVQNIKENDIPIKVYDYWLVGSNAAYNYTPESDIDIHIIVDTNIVTDVTILRMLYDYVKSSYSQKYNIKVKGHEVELYLEDIQTTAITNGIYSIMKDEWIKVPEKPEEDITIDIENNPLFLQWLANYEKLKDDECEQFLDDLHYLRKVSLISEGEFGEGNLIFKEFRNRGYIQDLKDRKYQAESDRLTLEKLDEGKVSDKNKTVKGIYKLIAKNYTAESKLPYYYISEDEEAITQALNSLNNGKSFGPWSLVCNILKIDEAGKENFFDEPNYKNYKIETANMLNKYLLINGNKKKKSTQYPNVFEMYKK